MYGPRYRYTSPLCLLYRRIASGNTRLDQGMQMTKTISLLKSLLHNLGVVLVGFGFAFLGRRIDSFLGLSDFHSVFTAIAAWLCLVIGFLIRVWAAFHFYEQRMKVISLVPQKKLITTGPFRFSRNPLYLGGNLFIFLGAVLFFGSPTGIVLTAINLFLVDLMIRREEKQLAHDFGEAWVSYRNRVGRWL
jgi:protein-S-isoprenylcysteine O-methyltransferase Ste14